jgi:hypothetical protein
MQQLFRRHHRSAKELLRRLDRVAGMMNPFLTLLLIGLAILNVTCLIGKIDSLQIRRLPQYTATAEPTATGCPGQAQR